MRVLLFTHGSDIDGMGSIILSKLAFQNVDYFFCETSTIDQIISDNTSKEKIKKYDLIFVTDLCPSNETIERIHKREDLQNKFVVLDHHQSNYNRTPHYDFVNVILSIKNRMTCATELFYEYILCHQYLEKKSSIRKYVEFTRLEDTWEWKKEGIEDAHNLTHIFNHLGRDEYIEYVVKKLESCKTFKLNQKDKSIIEFMKYQIDKNVHKYLKEYREIEVNHLKGALVMIEYQYRNEFPEYLRSHRYPLDFAMMICLDHNSVSIRSVSDCNVREIAEKFDGGGHDKAATFRIDDVVDKIYDLVLSKRD